MDTMYCNEDTETTTYERVVARHTMHHQNKPTSLNIEDLRSPACEECGADHVWLSERGICAVCDPVNAPDSACECGGLFDEDSGVCPQCGANETPIVGGCPPNTAVGTNMECHNASICPTCIDAKLAAEGDDLTPPAGTTNPKTVEAICHPSYDMDCIECRERMALALADSNTLELRDDGTIVAKDAVTEMENGTVVVSGDDGCSRLLPPSDGDSFVDRVKSYQLTRRDWQLYSNHAQSNYAANRFNAVLRENVEKGATWKTTQQAVYREMDLYNATGARDTEPECVLCEVLEILYDLPQGVVNR
jgi:hypothetical protein